MVFATDNNVTNEDFWKHTALTNEAIGLMQVKKDDILFIEPNEAYTFIKNFVTEGLYKDPDPEAWDADDLDPWRFAIESYCKYVWLTSEYLRDGKFRNYLGIHWNPEIKKYEIHPGGARQIIHYYFGPNNETFIGFNTNGVEANWNKKYNTPEEFIVDFPTAIVVFCRDYDTIIPHVLIDTHTINANVITTHAIAKQFFTTTKIEANFDLSELGYVPVKNYTNSVKVTLDKIDIHHMIKAFLLMPNYDNFSGYGVTIETT